MITLPLGFVYDLYLYGLGLLAGVALTMLWKGWRR